MDHYRSQGSDVHYYDPYVPKIGDTREHANWTGAKSIEWTKEALSEFDVAVISTDHPDVDYQLLVDSIESVVDTRNALVRRGIEARDGWKA
jgi:UDP-N-acetyl-D-glucosamine dehydrogenase